MDSWDNTTLGDGHVGEEFVDLLVIADGQHEVSWLDGVHLAVMGNVPAQLQQLGSEILQHSSQEDGGVQLHPVGDEVVSLRDKSSE